MNFKIFSLIILASVASAIAQNNQGGTLVTAPIRPFAVQDTFPTAWANEIKGGPFTSTNLAGLSNIPTSRLEIGSLGYAQDTGLFHRLTSTNPVTWSPIDGSNFTNLPISATNISEVLSIESGGTGATNAGGARTNLGLGATNAVSFLSITLDDLEINSTNAKWGGLDRIEWETRNLLGGDWTINDGPLIIEGGTNSSLYQAQTRTNLGLGATWLTNDNVTNFRTAIGLGTTNNVVFKNGFFDYVEANDIFVPDGGEIQFEDSGTIIFGSAAPSVRTNLGLGASWLTNSTAPLFWTSVPASPTNSGTAGQIAYTNNFLYICISNNTWRRVQLGTW